MMLGGHPWGLKSYVCGYSASKIPLAWVANMPPPGSGVTPSFLTMSVRFVWLFCLGCRRMSQIMAVLVHWDVV